MVHAKKGIEDSSQIQKTMPMEVPKKKKKKVLSHLLNLGIKTIFQSKLSQQKPFGLNTE